MSLAHDDSWLQLIDNECRLYKINLSELKIIKNTALSRTNDPLLFDYYRRPFALGQHLAYIFSPQSGSEHVIDTDNKILPLLTLHYNDHEHVSKAAISENDAYVITGNERGRSFVFSAVDGSIQVDLPVASDVVSAVSISEEYHLAARASFSKELIVHKLNTVSIVFQQKLDAVIEMMVFLDDRYLLAITRNGKLLKIDLYRQKIEKEIVLDDTLWPSVMTLSHSQKYLYIGTRESILFAVHIKTLDILYRIKLPYQGITTLARGKQYFMIGFKTGELLFYNHREFESEFIQYINLRQIKEAALLFTKNIFLMSHRETKKIYEYWLEEKEKVMALLARGEIEEAQNTADPYLFHPKCKLEFNDLEILQPDLMALNRYVRSLSFAAAYQLATLKPELKKTSMYATMEAIWNRNLQKAQILLARSPLENQENAKELLHLFAEVEEKKPIIENMLKRAGIFTLAENAVKEKNFTFYYKVVSQNGFLEFTPLYQKVLQVAERVQQETTNSLNGGNYKQALILADILLQFRPYAHQANRLKEVSKALMILDNQITHKKLLEAVKTQEQYQLQSNYPLVQTLEEMKQAFQEEQEVLLKQKQFDKLYANIAPYMDIAICRQNIANIMRKVYLTQLEDAVLESDSRIDWSKTFLNYFQFFPMDKLLVEFARKYDKMETLQHIVVGKTSRLATKYPKNVVSYLKG
jgi:hypothetical protein